MALLQLLSEEPLAEDSVTRYFDDLYRVVCVAERPDSVEGPNGVIRTTYVVDWEQLVHLLEDYSVFGEDIVEVTSMSHEEARTMRRVLGGVQVMARA